MMRAMPYLALLLGAIIAGLGAWGLAVPEEFGAAIGEIPKRINVYGIAAIRVAIGVILMLAAGSSRAPFLLGALGLIIVLGGLATPFMAAPLRQSVERWLAGGGPNAMRGWCALALVAGTFAVWATMPKRRK